jgi:hypothetical protein
MALTIQDIFVDPPMAVARLGGSSVPQDAYVWVQAPEPRAGDTTTIAPTWSLLVQQDATVNPILPTQIVLRDGAFIRPVCPFFELWARLGKTGSHPKSWKDARLTPALLAASGASLSDLVIQADAKNLKAARRTGIRDLSFGTFPPVRLAGDDHAPVPLLGTSPSGARQPLIPPGRNIPLGEVQILRSRPQPTQGAEWAPFVNVEILRFRFTPARGFVYGVPDAAKRSRTQRRQHFIPVDRARAFLNPLAGWAGATVNELVQPDDTYDGADVHPLINPSLGVVDDTCEVRFDITLQLPGRRRPLSTAARTFVAPPDFAPDRRPFLSLADELNDRSGQSGERTKMMTPAETEDWVQDLFERIFETTSLFNVDFQRDSRAIGLTGKDLRSTPIKHDHIPEPSRAMGGRDVLRNDKSLPLPKRSTDEPLPLTQRAVTRHRELADLTQLKDFIAQFPGRLETLVRPPFKVEAGATIDSSSMRMPPFMRNSNALPLSLSAWQYEVLIDWVKKQARAARAKRPSQTRLSPEAANRRKQVLARVARNARMPQA